MLKLEDFIGGSSHLERSGFLQIFAFKVDLSITELVYEVTGKDRRLVDVWFYSFLSFDYLLLCWNYH